jgi:hypothetical protein
MTPDQRAEYVAMSKVFVDHTVMFQLAPKDRFVVPRRNAKGYVSVGYITVHLHDDQRVQITASGPICKKDGTPSAVTNMNESVDLPDPALWAERARAALTDGSIATKETPDETA